MRMQTTSTFMEAIKWCHNRSTDNSKMLREPLDSILKALVAVAVHLAEIKFKVTTILHQWHSVQLSNSNHTLLTTVRTTTTASRPTLSILWTTSIHQAELITEALMFFPLKQIYNACDLNIILIITNHLISFLVSLIISLVCIWINFFIALYNRLFTSWFDSSTAVFLTYCIIANGTKPPISPSSAFRYDQRDIYYALTILLKIIMSSAFRKYGQLPSGCIDARINVYLLNLR